jgi:hypothetical protein
MPEAVVVAEVVVFAAVAFAAAVSVAAVFVAVAVAGDGWLRRTGLLLQLSLGSGDLPILLKFTTTKKCPSGGVSLRDGPKFGSAPMQTAADSRLRWPPLSSSFFYASGTVLRGT